MKFPTAKEIRESVKQNNKKTIKLARKNFNKYKKKFLCAIIVTSSQGLFEYHCQLFYTSEFSYRYNQEIYQEEYKRIAISFFTSRGYKISFYPPSTIEPTSWARMIINWRDEE